MVVLRSRSDGQKPGLSSACGPSEARAKRVAERERVGVGPQAQIRNAGMEPLTMKTTRREFLTAAAVSPILLGIQNKSGTKLPVMGEGAFTYEAIHDWGELPARIKWGNT